MHDAFMNVKMPFINVLMTAIIMMYTMLPFKIIMFMLQNMNIMVPFM